MAKGQVKRVVLAYSGGLDTSVILKWLQEAYGCEVVTFTAKQGAWCACRFLFTAIDRSSSGCSATSLSWRKSRTTSCADEVAFGLRTQAFSL